MRNNEYLNIISRRASRSPCFINCIKAFFTGGIICCFGQLFCDIYIICGISEMNSKTLSSVTLIFIAGLFTGIGFFDKIARFGGAGTLVPITGFSNAVAAPAIDAKSEGFVTGVGAKMFTIAGPVIVYGCAASAIYGVIYYFIRLWS